MSHQGSLAFPNLRTVELESFSLYSLKPSIKVDLPDGVFCLAGANGLGKSTFIAAVNYGITGIVNDPNRDFKSESEHLRHCRDFASDYFSGRIAENDREHAEVSVTLDVGRRRFEVTRGMFEPERLRKYRLTNLETDQVIHGDEALNGESKLEQYQKDVTAAVGLSEYDQFVFLQHFVLTFDENRRLLLWNKEVLTTALYLSIGTDYDEARRATELRREKERADSRARNYNWQASDIRSKIEAIEKAVEDNNESGEADADELEERHRKLTSERDRRREQVTERKEELENIRLEWSQKSVKLASLKEEYQEAFSNRIEARRRADLNPVVSSSLSGHECAVCGNSSAEAISNIRHRLESHSCPLCESELPEHSPDDESIDKLKEIDTQIEITERALEQSGKEKRRLSVELEEEEARLDALQHELDSFEEQNENFLAVRQSSQGQSQLGSVLKSLRHQMNENLRLKKKKRKERDERQEELMSLQRDLANRYREVEDDFVPTFEKIAESFIGVDLTIRLNPDTTLTSPGFNMDLEVQGDIRRKDYQLSESQRFFLDIAFRMSLADFMSSDDCEAGLFIDTPEGSLDIAYEARAGSMLAGFSDTGHDILMTANINTSELLRRLAKQCTPERMKLVRMTGWAELSEVQRAELPLFEEAFDQIEADLAAPASS